MELTTDRGIPPPTTVTATSSTSNTSEDGSPSHDWMETLGVNENARKKMDEALWINNARTKVNQVRPKREPLIPCTIFKVPEHIRRCDAQAYEPLIVPIGPYHHEPSQKSAIRRQLLDDCLLELKALDSKIRRCYSEDFPKLKANVVAELMLLDGCFIIHLLLKHAKKEREEGKKRGEVVLEVNEERKKGGQMMAEKEKGEEEQGSGLDEGARGAQSDRKEKGKKFEYIELEERVGLEFERIDLEFEIGEEEEEIEGPFAAGLFTVRLVPYDLLKLENQIPFFIIEKLFEILKTPDDQGIDLPEHALGLFRNIHPQESKSFRTSSMGQIHHLLHLFHSSRVSLEESTQGNASPEATYDWIPSATELAMAGVKFREKREPKSFLDITFKDGKMEIPPLRVYDHMGSLFRNLIAFEQCYFDTMTSVTIYAVFMDCIIDEAKDARLLHLKGILVNRLSTDEAMAGLFNQLCNQICYAADRNYLQNLFAEVNKYYNSKIQKWRAGLMRDYFKNPWTILSVIAAVSLLLLTIEQAVFSGLSYLRPPKGS
ncbi:UPF0481 protein At3g47200-like [Elaeis guineensis]|uniref:UPF0481 protein At3g47200-like n=1 Tax=Elaeis guineensis var. tenera TaxID=51953 RepID=UPI003C6D6082